MKIESISPVQPSQDAGAEAVGHFEGRSVTRAAVRGEDRSSVAGLARWLARNVAGDPRSEQALQRLADGDGTPLEAPHGPAQVRCWMLLPLALLLGGCVSQPAPMSPKVTVGGSVGGVSLQARQAQLRLRLYAVVQGRMQTIAERRYRVSGLPLRYAFDLEVDRLEGEALYLRTELSWVGVAAVQASAWQQVAAGVDERVRLVRRDCFPNCTAARPEERSGND